MLLKRKEVRWVRECGTFKNNHLIINYYTMNVDVEVYISGIVKFFKKNPKELLNLVPKDKEEKFYGMLKKSSFDNYKKGEDYVLTRKQIIDICVELNEEKIDKVSKNDNLIETLTDKLNLAIENEEYEEAAKLRDKIKEIS